MQSRVDETRGLGDKRALPRKAGCLRHKTWPRRGIKKAAIGLLRGEQVTSLALELRRERWDWRWRGSRALEITADIARLLGLKKSCRRTAAKTSLLGLLEALRTRRNISCLLGHQSTAKSLLLLGILLKLRILLLKLGVLLLLLLLKLRILLELRITTRIPGLHGVLVPWLPLGHGGGRKQVVIRSQIYKQGRGDAVGVQPPLAAEMYCSESV